MSASETRRIALFMAAASLGCVLAAHQSMAQALGGGDIAGTVTQAGTWAITIARAAAVLIALAGFAMFATGRHAWQGGIVMLIGVAGALKADVIVQTLFGA